MDAETNGREEWECGVCLTSNWKGKLACRGCGNLPPGASKCSQCEWVSLDGRPCRKCQNKGGEKGGGKQKKSGGEEHKGEARFFRDVLDGKRVLRTAKDVATFCSSIVNHGNPFEVLRLLVGTSKCDSLERFQTAFSLDDSPGFFHDSFIPLVRHMLDCGEFNVSARQMFRMRLLHAILDAPLLKQILLHNIPKLSSLDWSPISRLVLLCSFGPDPRAVRNRSDADIKSLAAALHGVDNVNSLKLLGLFHTEPLRASSPLRVMSTWRPEFGTGRHDNDFSDFRAIQILPTREELVCGSPSFIPPLLFGGELERHFRLLREDFVGSMREEIKAPHAGFSCTALLGVRVCNKPFSLSFYVEFQQIEERKKKNWSLEDFWMRSKWLQQGSVVTFFEGTELLCVGIVCVRELKELASQKPCVGIRFPRASDWETMCRKTGPCKSNNKMRMVPSRVALFAYEYVLQALQMADSLPLLLGDNNSTRPGLSLRQCAARVRSSTEPLLSNLRLDESQQCSIGNALLSPVALIQGPPGTGKSFVGALIAKMIIAYTQESVLVVCLTNHALDSFLEELLERGVDKKTIVRIGGSKKVSERILPLVLNRTPPSDSSKAEKWTYAVLKEEQKELSGEIEECNERMCVDAQSMSWETAQNCLESSLLKSLAVPQGVVGENGKKLKPDYLWKRWKSGQDCGAVAKSVKMSEHWSWKSERRKEYLQGLCETLRREAVQDFELLRERSDRIKETLDALRSSTNGASDILRSKRIIGCTTTGAAKYGDLLRQVRCGVLLVEEAAEILEAHIISSLSQHTKHLIMIGDHKQLRPKVNNFELTIEKGHGHDLNRSLFERLVLKDPLIVDTLERQHRMRPEFSALIRFLTYPGLQDDPKVVGRENLRGCKQNFVFVNHSNLEDDQNSLIESASKVNTFEAEFCARALVYVLQQGYEPSCVTILTPYLGQLQALRGALSSLDFETRFSDLDRKDLRNAGIVDVPLTRKLKADAREVRVATVDNYQGEEADIVIVSLVRSNPRGDIGFLSHPERVNVLLSRARIGLILVGNMTTLISSKSGGPLWSKIQGHLSLRGMLFPGLPVVCPRHPGESRIAKSGVELKELAPEGGCARVCDFSLQCKHPCGRYCHVGDQHGPCRHFETQTCSKNHSVTVQCGHQPHCKKCYPGLHPLPKGFQRDKAMQHVMSKTIVSLAPGRDRKVTGHKGFQVLRVERIDNKALWATYCNGREKLQRFLEQFDEQCSPITVSSSDQLRSHGLTESLNSRLNEVYLFHGCKDPKVVEAIRVHGFDFRAASTGLFGEGTYFAENSSKSDEYTGDRDELTMFLARVCLGRFHLQKVKFDGKMAPCVQNCQSPCTHYRCDSLVCPTTQEGGCVGRHREFVVFDNAFMYPEFLIVYKRV